MGKKREKRIKNHEFLINRAKEERAKKESKEEARALKSNRKRSFGEMNDDVHMAGKEEEEEDDVERGTTKRLRLNDGS